VRVRERRDTDHIDLRTQLMNESLVRSLDVVFPEAPHVPLPPAAICLTEFPSKAVAVAWGWKVEIMDGQFLSA
jgi:hypothetical protein